MRVFTACIDVSDELNRAGNSVQSQRAKLIHLETRERLQRGGNPCMPGSLVDLQKCWKKLEKPGVRFDADKAIELVVQRCEQLEAVLQRIADGEAGAEERGKHSKPFRAKVTLF